MYVLDDDFDDEDDGELFFPDDPLRKKRRPVLADFLPKANITGPFDWGDLVAPPKPERLIVVRMQDEEKKLLVVDDLRLAVKSGNLEFVKTFLKDSKLPVDTVLKDDWAALMHAAISAQSEVLQFLLESGADPNLRSRGFAPIMAAVCATADCDKQLLEQRIVSCVNLLVQSGAEVNAVDAYGTCALHFAAKNNLIQVTKSLLSHKANVNSQDSNNDSAIHIAAKFGFGQLIRLLLESGADLNLTNNSGLKPEDTAISNGFSEIGDLLTRYRTENLVSVQALEKVVPKEKTGFVGEEEVGDDDDDEVAKFLHNDFQIFLQGYRLPDLEPVLAKHNITKLPDVLKLSREDLDKMGILSERKNALMKAIESFSLDYTSKSRQLPVPKKRVSSAELYEFMLNVTRQLKYIEASVRVVERGVGTDPGSLQRGMETIPPNGLEKEFTRCFQSSAAIHSAISAIGRDLMAAKRLGIGRPGLVTDNDFRFEEDIINVSGRVSMIRVLVVAGAVLLFSAAWKKLSLK